MKLLLIAGSVIATFLLYGYFVHASHDSQLTGLLIILCWLLSCILLFAALLVFLLHFFQKQKSMNVSVYFLYIFMMVLIGYGGIHKAFHEPLAG